MKTYTIKEIPQLFQLPSSTLRYYEEMGLLKNVDRTPSGQRIYTEDHIGCLKAICCFKRAGLTITDISRFFTLEDNEFTNIDEILALLYKHRTHMEQKLEEITADLIHINEKIAYHEAIKKAIAENRELPSWREFMD